MVAAGYPVEQLTGAKRMGDADQLGMGVWRAAFAAQALARFAMRAAVRASDGAGLW
jgi:hypothetical protein